MKVLLHFPATNSASTSILGRALLERGHEVIYTAIDAEDAAALPADASRMFIHTRWPMRKLLSSMRAASTSAERDWLRLEIEANIAHDYFDGDMAERVKAAAPDMIVADSALLSPLQFVAHAQGVPCAQVSLTFSRRWIAGPPLDSSLGPASSALHLAGARWLSSCLNRRVVDVPVPMQVAAGIERLATSAGYPADSVSFESARVPALTLFPELVACEGSLDFDAQAAAATTYLAIEPGRPCPEEVCAALCAFVDPARPLIYMAFGGQELDGGEIERIWPPLAAAFAGGAPWKTIIVAGSEALAARLALPGDDVLVLAHAPHAWLLQRAAAFVTTADLDAIRAAITQKVPIVAIPLRDDQPGNAERVAHHGIGVRLRPDLLTADVFNSAIRAVLDDGSLRANLRRLDDACREERGQQAAAGIIEKLAASAKRDAGTLRVAPVARSGDTARFDEPSQGQGLDEAWLDYASWCMDLALEPLWLREPDRVEAFRDLVADYRDAMRREVDPARLAHLRRMACERAAPHWHKGYGAVVCAMHPGPQRGAWLTRLEVAAVLARTAAGASPESERSRVFMQRYAEVSRELDAEWERRFGGRARMAR